MPQPMTHERRAALLSELGIVQWRARSGVAFPGAAARPVSDEAPACADTVHVKIAVDVPAPVRVDMVICADTHSEAEAELLARIISAVHDKRSGLHIEHCALDADVPGTHALFRLDDLSFASPATMLAQPSSKRPLWQALQDAVGRLP